MISSYLCNVIKSIITNIPLAELIDVRAETENLATDSVTHLPFFMAQLGLSLEHA